MGKSVVMENNKGNAKTARVSLWKKIRVSVRQW